MEFLREFGGFIMRLFHKYRYGVLSGSLSFLSPMYLTSTYAGISEGSVFPATCFRQDFIVGRRDYVAQAMIRSRCRPGTTPNSYLSGY